MLKPAVRTGEKKKKQGDGAHFPTLLHNWYFPVLAASRNNTAEVSYRFQLQKYLLIHSLVQEQLPHIIDHILNHRLVQFRLWESN